MSVSIDGAFVTATSPEGQVAVLPVVDLARLLSSHHPDTTGFVFPDGVKSVLRKGLVTIWIHETPPQVHAFRWIDPRSPVPYGPGTRYRIVRIALPYVLVMALLVPDPSGRRVLLGDSNECFFRGAPMKSVDDALLYPGLLNCSRFASQEKKPLSWICTQHLDRKRIPAEPDIGGQARAALAALLRCLYATGFNYSSEHHELSSWYTESAKADPRISPVEKWEEHSRANSLFGLDVKWIPVGKSVREVAERMFERNARFTCPVSTAADVERLVFRHGAREKKAVGK